MQLTTLFILFSAFIVKARLAGIIIETSKSDESGLVEAVVNILKSCYTDRINTVGLAGISAGAINKMLILKEVHTAVILIRENPRIINGSLLNPTSRQKLQVFVVTITNTTTLATTLMLIKNSKWWNHMASFLLLDWPVSKQECSNAEDILLKTWSMNIINSKFMCLHRPTGRLMIYTYNPYTRKAPIPWQLADTKIKAMHYKSNLFAQVYRDDKNICYELDFDKTIELDGHIIGASNLTDCKNSQHLMDDSIVSIQSNYGKTDGDICLHLQYYGMMIKYPMTYPTSVSALTVMTHYRGYMTQLEKIFAVLDDQSQIGVLVVCMITLLFFKFYLRKALVTSILNLVLIICNASLMKIPKKLAPRIYLGSLFLLVLTIQGIYQGKLASLLTNEKRLPNVNSMKKLILSDYTIHGPIDYNSWFTESAFQGRYVGHEKFNCTELILRDPKVACVHEKKVLIHEAIRLKLHLSRKDIAEIYMAYRIRPDWPLENRVNTILKRCFESDIRFLSLREMSSAIKNIKFRGNYNQVQTFKVLAFEKLRFAFVILGFGLGCATISFIVETIISRVCSKITTVRRYIRKRFRK